MTRLLAVLVLLTIAVAAAAQTRTPASPAAPSQGSAEPVPRGHDPLNRALAAPGGLDEIIGGAGEEARAGRQLPDLGQQQVVGRIHAGRSPADRGNDVAAA